MKREHRELGTIRKFYLEEERGPTFFLMLDFGGSGQGFGGRLLRGELRTRCLKDLVRFFKLDVIDQAVGLEVYALRAFSSNSANIEGLEFEGRIWTWRRFFAWQNIPHRMPLEEELEYVHSRTSYLECELISARARIAELTSDYVDWG